MSPGSRKLFASACIAAAAIVLAGIAVPFVAPTPGISDSELASSLPEGYSPDAGRGQVLYHLAGCGNCHSESAAAGIIGGVPSGGSALASFAGDFYPPNLTPDEETGIGGWSDAEFVNALKHGVGPDGRHLYPAFPYGSYAGMPVSDLLDIKAYLDGLDPVRSPRRAHDLGFPFNVRAALFYWKLLFHDSSEFVPDPSRSDEWNRGAILVNALGHCGFCHTPRNLLWAEDRGRPFEGSAPLKEGEPGAPRLAGIDQFEILNGLDEWSGAIDERSSMFLVTQSYSAHSSLEDQEAIATYLSSFEASN